MLQFPYLKGSLKSIFVKTIINIDVYNDKNNGGFIAFYLLFIATYII